ncbi:selenocysteine-specific translation elongation factor [Escherichia coli TA206]|uniref:selenocysteine-specific translation elongation factor n=1 Tax=Escherichia coli TaxID=562 RepID=UPI0001E8A75D|nr:selenocysteine-specific translation elongation factor [Escherichia coli]EGI25790.1 selenocysteine-specific translation elongation factor [Escherichia coli TA206]
MYAVIGTAGHVDHGKSALIQALTGTHPSHLPQEFARGMTIDLGFSCLRSPEGDEFGMIDVPGHERFLHNMLSSLWGLDLVLFVVAADEGWAPLSQEHLRVISALGIRNILVAINKCDLVDDNRLRQVDEEILEQFLSQCDLLPDLWHVSARTGSGIEALRQGIFTQLRQQTPVAELDTEPHLYIDRVFSVNGIGTTVTGTLRGGSIRVGDVLQLYPGNELLRVKSIQSYHLPRETAQPRSRVAMSFRQLKRNKVARGYCLAKADAEITLSREWIVQLQNGLPGMKRQCELEVALGTSHAHARCYLLGDGRLARLLLSRDLPAFLGQTVLLMQPGGNQMAGAGRVVWSGPINRAQRPGLMTTLINAGNTPLPKLRKEIQLAVNGYVSSYSGDAPLHSHKAGDWLLTDEYWQHCLSRCQHILTQAAQALSPDELAMRSGIPAGILRELVLQQCADQKWQQTSDGISIPGTGSRQLSPELQTLFNDIKSAGKCCFSAAQHDRPRLTQQLRTLVEKKLIVPMDDRMFITREDYQTLLEMLFSTRQPGALLSIAEAREQTGLARKQLIPLLNRMERDGWVRREGNLRCVKKTFLM